MKAVVTGATGRVGSALLEALPAGVDAEALVAPLEQHIPPVSWLRADITNRDSVMRGITCAGPDTVIHLAAMTDVDGCERDAERAFAVNRDGAAHVAEACAASGARLVFVSTDYVFDGRAGPYTEDDPTNPLNVYGRSKLAGEEAAARVLDNLLVVRVSVPFGVRREGASHNFVSWLVEMLEEGDHLRIVDDQFTTPAWLDELAEMLWRFAASDERGVLHYGTEDRLSRYAMAEAVCRTFGFDRSLVTPVRTSEMDFLAKRPLESGFVTDKLQDIVGMPPVLFQAALNSIHDHPA